MHKSVCAISHSTWKNVKNESEYICKFIVYLYNCDLQSQQQPNTINSFSVQTFIVPRGRILITLMDLWPLRSWHVVLLGKCLRDKLQCDFLPLQLTVMITSLLMQSLTFPGGVRVTCFPLFLATCWSVRGKVTECWTLTYNICPLELLQGD